MTARGTAGIVDASRRRSGGGAPVVLGYNTKGASTDASTAGRLRACVCTLASAATLQELHGWFVGTTPFCRYIICLYADNGSASPGAPGTRVAFTNPLTTTSGDCHLSQTGFSVPLAAGKYWVGYVCESSVTGNSSYMDILSFPPYYQRGINSGAAFNPPPNPFGTSNIDNSGRVNSCWAVVI